MGPAMTTDAGGRGCDVYTDDNVAMFWMVPRDDNERRQLDRWCRAVGPIVFVPNASIVVADAGPADRVVLAVWNVSLGAGNLRAFLEREIDLRCGPQPRVETHALLLLQEAFRQDESVPPDRPGGKEPAYVA